MIRDRTGFFSDSGAVCRIPMPNTFGSIARAAEPEPPSRGKESSLLCQDALMEPERKRRAPAAAVGGSVTAPDRAGLKHGTR